MVDLDDVSSEIFEEDLGGDIFEVPEENWREKCDLEFLSIGGDRVVYKLDEDTVVKFAVNNTDIWTQTGWYQNNKELQVYNDSNYEQKQWLADIFNHGNENKWLTMKYYENIVHDLDKKLQNKIYAELHEVGIDFVDDLAHNIAVYNEDEYVLIDYGYKTGLYQS